MIATNHQGADLTSPEFIEVFFHSMFGQSLQEKGGYIALASKDPGTGEFKQYFATDVPIAAGLAYDLYLLGKESYFAVHPRCRTSRKRGSVNALTCLHVDVDSNKRALDKLRQLEPSSIISSGSKNSYHGYFFFDQSLCKEQAGAVESLNKRLLQLVGVKVEAWDIARVLRVPNTANFKDRENPQRVDVVEWHPQRRYVFDEVCDHLGVSASDLEEERRTITSQESLVGSPTDSREPRGRYLDSKDRRYVSQLIKRGLFEPRSRNKAQLLLTRYFYEEGCSREETFNLINEFFRSGNNGLSKDWENFPDQVRHSIQSCVDGWFTKAEQFHRQSSSRRVLGLNRKDVRFIERQRLTQRDKHFLRDAMTWILNNERDGVIIMSARQMSLFRNCNMRSYTQKRGLLYELGIIELDVRHPRNSGLASEYRVLHGFGEPTPISRIRHSRTDTSKIDSLILGGMTNEDIRRCLPRVTRQRIQHRRQTFDRQAAVSLDADDQPQPTDSHLDERMQCRIAPPEGI